MGDQKDVDCDERGRQTKTGNNYVIIMRDGVKGVRQVMQAQGKGKCIHDMQAGMI